VPDLSAPLIDVVLVQTADAQGARLRAALAHRPELAIIGEVGSTLDAVAAAGRLQPDVMLMDVGLHDVAGHGVLRSVRAVSPRTRIVLHAQAADTGDAPGTRRWATRLVDAVLDPVRPPALEARLVLPDETRSVSTARTFVTELLTEWDLDTLVDACSLVVSELVANAVLHVPGACALEVTHQADVLRVAVADSGPGMPDLKVLGPSEETGRGLHIVTAFSSAWGVDPLDDGGKLVWAELAPEPVGLR
jgi:anti-sigma regulatory factor (Ser/Thr protein kinase)